MSPLGGPAFWSCGGEVLTTGGRPLAPGRPEALQAFYAALSEAAPDRAAQGYLEARRAELELALAQAGRWRRASAAAP